MAVGTDMWIESVHEDVRESNPDALPENLQKFYSDKQTQLRNLNKQLKLVKLDDENRNVHPERFTLNKRGKTFYVSRSDEGRAAITGGGSVTPEDLGF